MVKGRKKKVTPEKDAILEKVTPYDVYRFYQGPFKVNEVVVNRHRGETNPSLVISSRLHTQLRHKDFGDASWNGDCFNFVQQIFSCDFATALSKVDTDLKLGLGDGVEDMAKVITWDKPKIEVVRIPPLFQIVYYSKMSKRGLDYWAKFGQGESDLLRENIFQPKEIWRNKKKVFMGDLLTFAYHYESIDRWKIYRPFASKRTPATPVHMWKWDSNVPFDHIDNLNKIQGDCQIAVMAKSKKDRMVLMKALQTDCIADVQAEDIGCLTLEALDRFRQVDKRYIISDNDQKGKEFSWWLTKQHGFKHVNVPDKFLTSDPKCTDFADLCYHFGMDAVVNHFKEKGII